MRMDDRKVKYTKISKEDKRKKKLTKLRNNTEMLRARNAYRNEKIKLQKNKLEEDFYNGDAI